MRNKTHRAIAAAAAVGLALVTIGSTPASARVRHGGGSAAAFGAFAAMAGTIATIAAANNGYGYGYGGYYGPGPYYAQPYYAPYAYGPVWRHGYRRHWRRW